jgi:hypothetical protein
MQVIIGKPEADCASHRHSFQPAIVTGFKSASIMSSAWE